MMGNKITENGRIVIKTPTGDVEIKEMNSWSISNNVPNGFRKFLLYGDSIIKKYIKKEKEKGVL